jgi:hypothetical protein
VVHDPDKSRFAWNFFIETASNIQTQKEDDAMKGKNKCRILKEIRQKIADENDIPYVTRECTYQGECRGTCPKCEAELRYLERELEKRRSLGKTVAVAAVAAGLSLTLTACVPGGGGSGAGSGSGTTGPAFTLPIPTETETERPLEGEPTELAGDVYAPTETEEPLTGNIVPAETIEGELVEDTTEEPELLGDVAYIPDVSESAAEGTESPAAEATR